MAETAIITEGRTTLTALADALGDTPPPAIGDLPPQAQDDLVACLTEQIQRQGDALRDAQRAAAELLPWFLRTAILKVLEQ
jgi:hypothetical protein